MPVKILYFAWVREKVGKAEETLDVPAGVETAQQLMTWLKDRGPEYAGMIAHDQHCRYGGSRCRSAGPGLTGNSQKTVRPRVHRQNRVRRRATLALLR